jgi:hypothetical protein
MQVQEGPEQEEEVVVEEEKVTATHHRAPLCECCSNDLLSARCINTVLIPVIGCRR